MAANLLAPNGLSMSRARLGMAGDYAAQQFQILKTTTTAIGMGDAVQTGTGGSTGYVILAADGATSLLGVFAGVLPYYDTSAQQTMHGINGAWPLNGIQTPGTYINCLVIADPFATFIAQVNGGTYDPSWRGKNIGWLAGSNGAPNGAGRSTLVLSFASLDTTNTLPFRIVGSAGVTGGPQDPANTNPWIEVRMNTAEELAPTGI
jgi:hypothetical protein